MGDLTSNSVEVLPNLIKIGQNFRDNLHENPSTFQCQRKRISPLKHCYETLDNLLIFDSDMQLKTTHVACIVVFQMQQWLRQSATLLSYTYIVYTVLTKKRWQCQICDLNIMALNGWLFYSFTWVFKFSLGALRSWMSSQGKLHWAWRSKNSLRPYHLLHYVESNIKGQQSWSRILLNSDNLVVLCSSLKCRSEDKAGINWINGEVIKSVQCVWRSAPRRSVHSDIQLTTLVWKERYQKG